MTTITQKDEVLHEEDLRSAFRVLTQEAEALNILRDSLGKDFIKAVQIIADAKGRLIVTGMGKSGHVARKIAATMASTGTPAFFLHPAEASHGDLGMIKKGEDVVLALSYSGGSKELSDIIEFTRRFSIPLIAMTGGADSILAVQSDVLLLLPDLPEACPNNQAPTTSTTMSMALGDALAIALLERHNLSSEQFRIWHPGGKLGQRILRVSDIMSSIDTVPFVTQEESIEAVLVAITKGGRGCVCVGHKETRKLEGIITDGDIRRNADQNLGEKKAGSLMTTHPKTVTSNSLGAEAIAIMNAKGITSLPVVDEGKVSGIIHIHDCLQAAIA